MDGMPFAPAIVALPAEVIIQEEMSAVCQSQSLDA